MCKREREREGGGVNRKLELSLRIKSGIDVEKITGIDIKLGIFSKTLDHFKRKELLFFIVDH